MDHIPSSHQDEHIAVSADDLRQQFEVEIGKDALQHLSGSGKGGVTEEYPTEDNEVEGEQSGPETTDTVTLVMTVAMEYLLAEELVNGKCKTVKSAPDDEVERCSVPQSAKKHRDHQVDILPDTPMTIAAKRDVDIVANPR